MKAPIRTLALVGWCLLMLDAAYAQQHFPALEKGIQPEKLYQFGDIDRVNVFNGNLIIMLPIGPAYPLDGGLSYQLTLSYNSKVWDEQQGSTGIKAAPAKRSNAGLGWVVGMGRYVPADAPENLSQKALYEAADGGDHFFEGDVTKDGSFLRKRTISNTVVDIDFPDGVTQRFLKLGGVWNLNAIYGPRRAEASDADSVTISEAPTPPAQCPATTSSWWIIGDSKGRTQFLCYKTLDVDEVARPMIERVVVRGPAAGTAAYTEAVYTFEYAADVLLQRPAEDTAYNEPGWSGTHTVPLLTAVNLPDGSKFTFSNFDAALNDDQGQIRTMTLPTKGQIQYGYATYAIPAFELCQNSGLGNGVGVRSTGIATRTIVPEFNNPNVRHTWRYDTEPYQAGSNASAYQSLITCPPVPPDPSPQSVEMWDEFIVTIVDPLGGKVKNHFSVWPDGDYDIAQPRHTSPAGYQTRNYTYPYGTYDSVQNRYLSQEIFDPSGVLKRSVYVRHHRDDPDDYEKAHREESRRTFYHDGDTPSADDGTACTKTGAPLRCTGSDSTGWDGLGHFRTVASAGNFSKGGDSRTVTTTWNMLNGVARTFATGDPWILNTYESIARLEKGQTAKSEFWFAPATGFLKRQRTLKNLDGTRNARDLVVDLTMDATTGNLIAEAYHGGDGASLGTGSLNTLSLGTPQYKILHTYKDSTGKPVRWSEYDPSPGFKSVNQEIDPSTWVVTRERDSAGILTTAEYDSMSRPLWIKPDGRAWTKFEYVIAGTSAPAAVNVLQYPNGQTTGTTLTSMTHEFDGYGRPVVTKQTMPDSVISRRDTTYDQLGRKKTVSELWNSPSYALTTFTYDFAGRVKTVTAPDTGVTTFNYVGDRERSRLAKVALAATSQETEVETKEIYDSFGRLTKIYEKSGGITPGEPTGASVLTQYQYGVADQLVSAKTWGASNAVQERIFDYDGRGFLTWESQPESGLKTYTYDSRGHVVSMEVGAARTIFDLKYTYDGAERLTTVEARNPDNLNAYRPMKSFVYGTNNGSNPADYRLGKLQTATRYNYQPSAFGWPFWIVRVAETYEYKDTAGRRTGRTTTIATSSDVTCCWQEAKTITQSQTYDDLDQTLLLNYPMCNDCGAPYINPARGVTSTYSQGRLKSMSDFVSNITYWPNGMRNVLLHSNSMADTQTVHSSGMPRPGSLKFETYQACKAPTILFQTGAAIRPTAQSTIRLDVRAEGTAPLTYAWYGPDGTYLGAGQMDNSTIPPTNYYEAVSAGDYYVEISNSCRMISSKTIPVKVGNCVDPWIYDHSVTPNANGTFTLAVSAYGTGTLTYTWRRVSDNAVVGGNSATYVTPFLSASEQYQITITNSCGGTAATQTLQAYVPATTPVMTANAQGIGSGQIRISWNAVSGAANYVVKRKNSASAGEVSLPAGLALEYIDSGLAANAAYVYFVEARNASNDIIAASHSDLATTVSFTSLANATIAASHFNELLNAVNAVRGYVGWNAVGWGDIISPADPLPQPGAIILARHLLTIRARLNEALQFAGFAINGYAQSDLRGEPITDDQLLEVRGRVQ